MTANRYDVSGLTPFGAADDVAEDFRFLTAWFLFQEPEDQMKKSRNRKGRKESREGRKKTIAPFRLPGQASIQGFAGSPRILDTASGSAQYYPAHGTCWGQGLPLLHEGGLSMVANPVTPTNELQMDVEKTATETIFHCSGRITSSTSSQLTSAVRDSIPEKKPIILDLSKVTFMDSSGLGAVVAVWVSAKRAGTELKLVSLGQRVRDLLRVTGLEQVLAVSRFPDKPSF